MCERIFCAAFAGNPNCGKTTLFNALTGSKLKVANWPGVTVEKKEGELRYKNQTCKIVDLPGIYSLSSYTMEEKISRDYILKEKPDVVIDIADASCLERNLYLTIELMELGIPVILVLNMMDIVKERGMKIDQNALANIFGIGVIGISARKRTGFTNLSEEIFKFKEINGDNKKPSNNVIVYSNEVERKISLVSKRIKREYPGIKNHRWIAIKHLENDEEIIKKYPVKTDDIITKNYEEDLICQRYDFIHKALQKVVIDKEKRNKKTDKIDAILTHRILSFPAFFMIMALVFFLTFYVGDFLKIYLEIALDVILRFVSRLLSSIGVNSMITSLITEGIIPGVGGILTFLPNIFILFCLLAFLEDSGYMSRVAYVMNGIMGRIGLSGRAFIPMLLGFGCSVTAVMASRTLEDRKDRIKTILITPFMSCSARLPVYVLLSQMFFKRYAMLAAYSMYLIGVIVAIVVALILYRLDKSPDRENDLLIELVEYKMPNLRSVGIYVWDKIKDYITKAGTTIFVSSVVLWLVMNFNMGGIAEDISAGFAAMLGKKLCVILRPCGLDVWQICVALISGIAAKEVVASSLSVLYGIDNIASSYGKYALRSALAAGGFGAVNAYSMMLFCLLYVPCAATISVIRKETGSFWITLCSVMLQFGVAWICSTLFYQTAQIFIK